MDSFITAVLSLALVLFVGNLSSYVQGVEDSNAQAAVGSESNSSDGNDNSDNKIFKIMPQFRDKRELDSVVADFNDKTTTELNDAADDVINERVKTLHQFINRSDEDVLSGSYQENIKFDRKMDTENKAEAKKEEKEEAKRYQPTFVGKRYRINFGEQQSDPIFVDKKYKPMFVGKRFSPMIVGKGYLSTAEMKKYTPNFVGKRFTPHFIGKRSIPYFVGKRYTPSFIGKRYTPSFIGRRYTPSFVGKRYTPSFVGKRYTPSFVGKRYTPSFVGKRYTPSFVGKRYVPTFLGKRYTPAFVGKRDDSSNFGNMYVPSFVGKRNLANMINVGQQYLPNYVSQGNDIDNNKVLLSFNFEKPSNSAFVESKSSIHELKQGEHAVSIRRKRSLTHEKDDSIEKAWCRFITRQYTKPMVICTNYPLINKRFITPEFIGRRHSLSSLLSDTFQSANNLRVPVAKRFQAPVFIGKRNLAEEISPEHSEELRNSEYILPDKLVILVPENMKEMYRDNDNFMNRMPALLY